MNLTLLIDYFVTVFDTHPEPDRTFLSHFSPTPAQSTRLKKGEKTDSHIKSLVPNPRISPRFANDKSYVLDRQEILTSYFIKSTRRIHRSLMQSPRPDVGHYLDIALKNASKSSRQLSKVNTQFIIIFHIPISYFTLKRHFSLYIIQKKVKVCVIKMLQEGNTYHEVVSFCKVNGVSSVTLAVVIHQNVPMLYWP